MTMPPEQTYHSREPHADLAALLVRPEQMPSELVEYPQWVCWRYGERTGRGKRTKQPVNPRTLHNAGVHWPNSWSTFADAYAMYGAHHGVGVDGIGFVLTKDDPFVGVDVDRCITASGMAAAAQAVVEQMASYTEISPSGAGLRILVACPDFRQNTRTPQLEVYSHSRFLTLTGHHLEATPQTVTTVRSALLHALLPVEREATVPIRVEHASPLPEDEGMALWARIFTHDKYGADHERRFNGDLSLDRNDHSFAVIRLLNCLVRWTNGDPAKMRTLMFLSPLANEKWMSKRGQGDWLDYQIANAIAYVRGGK